MKVQSKIFCACEKKEIEYCPAKLNGEEVEIGGTYRDDMYADISLKISDGIKIMSPLYSSECVGCAICKNSSLTKGAIENIKAEILEKMKAENPSEYIQYLENKIKDRKKGKGD